MDTVSRGTRSRIMASIRSKDTGPELALRRALHRIGLRYRLHDRSLPGTPDIVFRTPRIAVFVDGDFWHGRLGLPKSNREFWRHKFETNSRRDQSANEHLSHMGWTPIRASERAVSIDAKSVARAIRRYVRRGPRGGSIVWIT